MFSGLLESGQLYLKFDEEVQEGMRLGRNMWLDARSLGHMVENSVEEMSSGPLKSKEYERVLAVLDQGQLGSCFPPGTHVRMADGSERAIEDVRLGEHVVTAEGGTGRVIRTLLRDEEGGLLRLQLWGHAHLRMTREHPVLTARGYVSAAELRVGDAVALPKYTSGESAHVMTADHVTQPTHRLVRGNRWQGIPGRRGLSATAHELPEKIELTERFGRLIGLFLAEGNCDSGKAVWSLNIDERDTLGAEIVSILADYGVTAATREIPTHMGFRVAVYGTAWTRLLSSLCGNGAGLKRLHPTLAGGPREFLAAVFSGWRDGDGHQRVRNAEHVGVTISRELAIGMYDIAQALGYRPVIRHVAPVQNKYAATRRWRWEVATATESSKNYSTQDETHVWRKVREMHLEDYVGPVYDLTVEGAHSYVAEGIGVHNCTGNAGTGSLGTQPFYDAVGKAVLPAADDAKAGEDFAIQLYKDATVVDGYPGTYPPDDTGSSGLAICKVLKTRGTIKGYRFARTAHGFLRLLQNGPVLQGMPWYKAFFTPDKDGFIDADPNWASSGVAGGHEIEAVGVELDSKDAFNSVITYVNSWGTGWGDNGRFRMRLRTYEKLNGVDLKQYRV